MRSSFLSYLCLWEINSLFKSELKVYLKGIFHSPGTITSGLFRSTHCRPGLHPGRANSTKSSAENAPPYNNRALPVAPSAAAPVGSVPANTDGNVLTSARRQEGNTWARAAVENGSALVPFLTHAEQSPLCHTRVTAVPCGRWRTQSLLTTHTAFSAAAPICPPDVPLTHYSLL